MVIMLTNLVYHIQLKTRKTYLGVGKVGFSGSWMVITGYLTLQNVLS